MELRKIRRNTAYGTQTYEQLKYHIISGQIKPGEIINEQQFSEALGISRTPLRDALGLMESEGWIERRGKFRIVAPLRWKDFRDLFEVREPLDTLCLELAMPKVNEKHLRQLNKILDAMRAPLRKDELLYYNKMKLDTDFHQYIAYMTGNHVIIALQGQIREKIVRCSAVSLRYFNISPDFFAGDHMDILESLQNCDLEAGKKALHLHYAWWIERMLKLPEMFHFDPEDDSAVIDEVFDA